MVNRIKELILSEGLTSGSFADAIGVQRSSMSHIVNGRNNPSLDFIVKTLQQFPRISPGWLLMGTGPMYIDEQISVKQKVREPSIFDTPTEPPLKVPEKIEVKPPEKQVVRELESAKFIDKVLIFYSDHTYGEFFPGKGNE